MDKEVFRHLKLKERYTLLSEEGVYLASRYHGGFHCFLYSFQNLYVEAWKPVGINIIQWIEIVNHDEVVDSYLGNIDVKPEK